MNRRDITLLFSTRIVRLFAYGFLSVVLVLYLVQAGLSEVQVGVLLSLTLAGDAAISLWLTTNADRMGRKRMLIGGVLAQVLQTNYHLPDIDAYRIVLFSYALAGGVLIVLFLQLSPAIEARLTNTAPVNRFGLSEGSRGIVAKLSTLFALDAFAGGFVVQSLIAYWFFTRFNVETGVIGAIFFGANILAGISALSAASIARRIGLINTMVATHLPSNVLLMLVPLMPALPLAIIVLLLRFSISQMDVPTRQSYVMAVVQPQERSAAAGVTGIARSVGAALSPALSGIFLANPALLSLPFFLGGGLKIVYDLLLYRAFKTTKPPEEQQKPAQR